MVVFPFFRHQPRSAIASFLISITKVPHSRRAPAQRVERASARDELHQRRRGARHRLRGFGFIEPGLLGAIAQTAKDGNVTPKVIEGQFVTRMAHQQIQQVMINMQNARQPRARS